MINIRFGEDNVQKGHFELSLEGNFLDTQQSRHLMESKLLELLQENPKILIVNASDAAIMSDAMWAWAELVFKYLDKCQVIYRPSQLMMRMKYDSSHTSKRPQ
ncbi:MAG: hypothetical protein UW30_C0013G0008 [Candidatus Giovannonibacteria bacterium GW2011_GWA2_44_13b]|uniref:STAS domain-containing protein n=2 Tax=Candidatus Giovannoniibacteriota TaxID=1752738 RepID=A0A0G1JZX1_9BACT|nr:MAG: hypothetical protein UW30_C0013G0008 [Candidatus Giovannonibacteria bacterium GW2011_GWA2_44_13b]OGF81978.1 MAG: hypothetical protein A2924_04650 [Candidatus Giovannonibacteria bacterium RIFCSPLOWO2_01_FULL_44_16]